MISKTALTYGGALYDLAFFLLFVRSQEFFNDFPPIHEQGSKGV